MSGIELWLASEWAARLSQVLESMTGQAAQSSASEGGADGGDLSWWRQELDAAPGAAVWLGAAEPDWTAVGDVALKAAGIDDAGPADIRSTFLEAASQALSATAQTLGARLEREVACGALAEAAGPEPGLPRFTVTTTSADFPGASLLLVFSRELMGALEPSPGSAPRPAGAAEPSPAIPRTMELLLDVELPVSVSFGRAQLPLRDVLKLTSGSIVELNRSVSEPVEIVVNNCVIARGEVVVLEGNYGVRIHQIVSRQERLRTLY